ncbi:fibrobacter succinogenes major paralogous domain-containing protein [Candidatus Neomarinimicrobiota bacterium]
MKHFNVCIVIIIFMCCTCNDNSNSDYNTLELAFDVTHASTALATDGAIDLIVTGGKSPMAYSWSNGASTEDVDNLVVGLYTVTVTSDDDQTVADSIEVTFDSTTATGNTVTDIDGNVYGTVTIGSQVWMTEDLKTTRFSDGDQIPNVTDDAGWEGLRTPGYCWYDNDISNKADYGGLYNWYTVNTGRLAPTGWHVPTKAEWTTLVNYLGGEDIAGGKLKEAGTEHWWSPNRGATNESGFTALPGGYRVPEGTFYAIGLAGIWLTSSELDGANAWCTHLDYDYAWEMDIGCRKPQGVSVRCIKD